MPKILNLEELLQLTPEEQVQQISEHLRAILTDGRDFDPFLLRLFQHPEIDDEQMQELHDVLSRAEESIEHERELIHNTATGDNARRAVIEVRDRKVQKALDEAKPILEDMLNLSFALPRDTARERIGKSSPGGRLLH